MLMIVNKLKKIYKSKQSNIEVEALKNINFSVEDGEYIAIMGESGSGKTTLLNLLALFDKPTSGNILLNDQDVNMISNSDIANFRRNNLGFVFQDFNLIDTFNLKENIAFPLVLNELDPEMIETKVKEVTQKIGIEDILKKYPYEVSGGQNQRAAIARALINDPMLILADEPTGSLDSNTSKELLNLFKEVNDNGHTIIMVTHSIKAASYANRVLFIKDGEIFHQLYRTNEDLYTMQAKIADTMQMLQRSI